MRYFAYGSNMDLVQMSSRCPGATVVGLATLPGHRIAFVIDETGYDGGVATVVPDDASTVTGVLWEIDDTHLKALDEWETYPVAYDRYPITVHAPDPVEALIYVANFNAPLPPSDRYLGVILRGLEANRAPAEYAALIRQLAGRDA